MQFNQNYYRENRHLMNVAEKDVELAHSILYDSFTKEWCNKYSNNHYVNAGYFPPNAKKTTEKISGIKYLNLDNTSNLKILDIGTGTGQFIKLCNHFGHNATGTEISEQLNSPLSELYNHYRVDVFNLKIETEYVILPEKYNVITLFRTVFNEYSNYNKTNWLNLKNNLLDYLEPGGIVFLKTNLKFLKSGIDTASIELLKAFGDPVVGWNSFTYCIKKI
jgi:SAM-dependent methyltransferase